MSSIDFLEEHIRVLDFCKDTEKYMRYQCEKINRLEPQMGICENLRKNTMRQQGYLLNSIEKLKSYPEFQDLKEYDKSVINDYKRLAELKNPWEVIDP